MSVSEIVGRVRRSRCYSEQREQDPGSEFNSWQTFWRLALSAIFLSAILTSISSASELEINQFPVSSINKLPPQLRLRFSESQIKAIKIVEWPVTQTQCNGLVHIIRVEGELCDESYCPTILQCGSSNWHLLLRAGERLRTNDNLQRMPSGELKPAVWLSTRYGEVGLSVTDLGFVLVGSNR